MELGPRGCHVAALEGGTRAVTGSAELLQPRAGLQANPMAAVEQHEALGVVSPALQSQAAPWVWTGKVKLFWHLK